MSTLSQFSGGKVPLWVSGNTYGANDVVRSPTNYQRYVRIITGAGTTDPISDSTNWRPDGASPIKSIQRGVISLASSSQTTTITSVNTSKSTLHKLGESGGNSGGDLSRTMTKLVLTNSTTITASTGVGSDAAVVSWELVEYY